VSSNAVEVTKVVVVNQYNNDQAGRLVGAQVAVGDSVDAFDATNVQCGATVASTSGREVHTFICAIPGRYVFVQNEKVFTNLFLAEVLVEIDGVAFEGGYADMISFQPHTLYPDHGPADFARDKNTATFTSTGWVNRPWWRFDTGTTFSLTGSTIDDGVCMPCAPGLYKARPTADRCQFCPQGYHADQPPLPLPARAAPKGITLASLDSPPAHPVLSARTTTKSHKLPPLPVLSVLLARTPIPLDPPYANSAQQAKN